MAYFNRNCEKIELKKKNMQYLSQGCCAQVFRYGDMVFKEYFSYLDLPSKISLEMFDLLKTINNKHFVELYEIYSNMNLFNLALYKAGKLMFTNDAYTAKYYADDSVNILCESNDYILDNLKELEILFEIFTDNSIVAHDVKRANSIVGSNGIVIIDPDCFYIAQNSKNDIAIANKKKLLKLLTSICLDSAKSCTDQAQYWKMVSNVYYKLTNIKINENTDVTHEVSKKLKYVKKPINYLLK